MGILRDILRAILVVEDDPEQEPDEKKAAPRIGMNEVNWIVQQIHDTQIASDKASDAASFLHRLETLCDTKGIYTVIHLEFKTNADKVCGIDLWVPGGVDRKQEAWGNPMLYYLTRLAELHADRCNASLLEHVERIKP